MFDLLSFYIDVYMDVPADTYLVMRNIRSFSLEETKEFNKAVYIIHGSSQSITNSLQTLNGQSVNIIILSPSDDDSALGIALTTLPINTELVLNEDVPATLIHGMGCNVPSRVYSTGAIQSRILACDN